MKRVSLTHIIIYAIAGIVLAVIGVLIFRALCPSRRCQRWSRHVSPSSEPGSAVRDIFA
ncbi:MAG: hypothetical protein IPI37_08115 [Bacteroidales bacterium]|nr:hypothetical protein [Bacteroidales bacterium]